MRDDQFLKLQQLEEKLTDAFLLEADPEQWPGHGVIPRDLTQHQRGDRFWCKKNAVATITMCMKVGSLLGMVTRRAADAEPPPDGDGGDEGPGAGLLDAEIAEATREAQKLLTKLERRTRAKTPG